MNLNELNKFIERLSLAYPTVQEYAQGDIYTYLNSGEHKYPCVFLTIESISANEDVQNINCTLFYVDRLLDDSSNKLDIQTVSLTALKSIIEKSEELNQINFTSINYTPFTEKFADLCAGAFAQCNIQINEEMECSEDYELATLTIKEDGLYDVLGYRQVLVDVTKVRTIDGHSGDITLGKGLTIDDNNVLSGVNPTFEEGDNITITHTATEEGDNYKFDVPDMRYDDTEIKGMIEGVAGEVEDLSDRVSGDEDRISDAEDRLDSAEERLDTVEGNISSIDSRVGTAEIDIDNLEEGLNTLETRIDGDEDRISDAEDRLDSVEAEIAGLDDITIPTIVPTTTNFIKDEKYTIHTAIERTANLFAGYWNYIKTNITDLIPSQASKDNQLADKSFVNETVAQNAANFRGNWNSWNDVPTDGNLYPADYAGNKIPTNNDYLVVTDASGYDADYDGSWRFLYTGDWNTVGKSGWSPAYRIGSAFTDAQQAAIDSTITSDKVNTYDSYEARIGANETNKVDKINTANKIYGTDAQGFQTGYEAGENVTIADGKISAVDTVYDDTAISNRVSAVEGDRIRFYKPTGIAAKTSSPYMCAQYVISEDEQFVPVDGMTIKVRIPVAGHGTYGTAIVVNGEKHPIVYNVNSMISTRYGVNGTLTLTYNATQTATLYDNSAAAQTVTGCWQFEDYDSTNVYQLRHNSGTYVASEDIKRYKLCVTDADGLGITPLSSGSATSGHEYCKSFNPFGQILYLNNSTTNAYAKGDAVTPNQLYNQTTFDMRYTFNGGTTMLTANKDVYLKCALLTDGTFELEGLAQDLPTTADYRYYIYIGHSYSAYQIEKHINNPIYYYSETYNKILEWDGNAYYFKTIAGKSIVGSGNIALKTSDLTNDSNFVSSANIHKIGQSPIYQTEKLDVGLNRDILAGDVTLVADRIDGTIDFDLRAHYSASKSQILQVYKRHTALGDHQILCTIIRPLGGMQSIAINWNRKGWLMEWNGSDGWKELNEIPTSIVPSYTVKLEDIYNWGKTTGNYHSIAGELKTINDTSLLGTGNLSLQPKLSSGTNIKTINYTSVLGSGNISVQPTLTSGTNIKTINNTSVLGSGNISVQPTLVSGTNIKTINGNSILGSGNIEIQGGGTTTKTRRIVAGNALACSGLRGGIDDIEIYQKAGHSYFFHEFITFKRIPDNVYRRLVEESLFEFQHMSRYPYQWESGGHVIRLRITDLIGTLFNLGYEFPQGIEESLLIDINDDNDFDIYDFMSDKDYAYAHIRNASRLTAKTTSPNLEIYDGKIICVAKLKEKIFTSGRTKDISFAPGPKYVYRETKVPNRWDEKRRKTVQSLINPGTTVKRKHSHYTSCVWAFTQISELFDRNTLTHNRKITIYKLGKCNRKSIYGFKLTITNSCNIGTFVRIIGY